MAMSDIAANGGKDNPATHTQPHKVKTAFKQVGPGQFGLVAVETEPRPIKVRNSDGSTSFIGAPKSRSSVHHGELSELGHGADQKGFDTQELPVIHDHNPDA